MKKTLITLGLLAGCSLFTNAQYWHHLYPTTTGSGQTNIVSTAVRTQGISVPNDQYIIGSYQTSTTPGKFNFEIRRIDESGIYSLGGPPYNHVSFFDGYDVYKATVANGSPSLLMDNTHGISIIETLNAGPFPMGANDPHYGVAGTVSDPTTGSGCFFLLLNADGAPVNTLFFDFPPSASNPSKPLLCEDVNFPGEFYICGSFFDSNVNQNIMYALRVNSAGMLNWSNFYDSGVSLIPFGMVQSPFNTSELVVVGLNAPDGILFPGRGIDAFFMKLDLGISGAVVPGSLQVYGNSAEQHFQSIAPAFSPWSGNGFVVGGLSAPVGGIGNSWMLKLDQSGNPLWNTMISGTSGSNQGITGVLERLNTNSDYEYYGVTSDGTSQMTVFKLDQAGALWTSGGALNEFEYLDGGGAPAFISMINTAGSPAGEGIQVFGTDVSGGTYSHYMVKAHFNGYSGSGTCNEAINSISNQGPGPNSIINPAVLVSPGLNAYGGSDFYINWTFTSGDFSIVSVGCTGASGSGSNARSINGINENSVNVDAKIFPNPSSERLEIVLNVEKQGLVEVKVFNSLGMCVKQEEQSVMSGKSALALDVEDLPEGLYTLNCSMAGKEQQSKFIIKR